MFFYFGAFSTKEDTTDFSLKKYSERESSPDFNINKNAYFGDLHIHTSNSFDAYTFGTLSTPKIAYKYAQGESIPHPTGYDMQLEQPLDFYAVTDHATFLGMLPAFADTSTTVSKRDFAKKIHNLNSSENLTADSTAERANIFSSVLAQTIINPQPWWHINTMKAYFTKNIQLALASFDYDVHKSAWEDIVRSANEHNDPGNFTAFIGYEFTTSTDTEGGNLHRNVLFNSSTAPITLDKN